MQKNQIIRPENYEDTIKKLQNIENSLDLKTFSYKGVDLWPLLKYQIGIMNFDTFDSRKDKMLGHWKRLLIKLQLLFKNNFLKTIFYVFFKREENINFKKSSYLFLSDEYSKRLLLNKTWIDVFIYPFIKMKSIKDDDYIILRSNQNQSKLKAPFTKEVNISSLVIRSFIESKLVISKLSKNNQGIFNDFIKIKEIFDGNEKNLKFPKFQDLISEANFINKLSLKFHKIINKVKPEEVIVTHYLGYVTAGICHAAKQNGIRVSDIQHGVQGHLHPAYNFRNFPANGYNTTPDRYYVWNKNDFQNIALWSDNKSVPEKEIIGNTTKYLVEKDKKIIELYNAYFESAFIHYLLKQLVLITLCLSYYIPDIFLDIISESNENTFFLIRFHPSTSEFEKKAVIAKLLNLKKQNYEIKKSSEIPIHIIFKYIQIHLGIVSTAILESLEYDIKTIATGSRAKAYYEKQSKNGLLIFSNSSDYISSIILDDQKSAN